MRPRRCGECHRALPLGRVRRLVHRGVQDAPPGGLAGRPGRRDRAPRARVRARLEPPPPPPVHALRDGGPLAAPAPRGGDHHARQVAPDARRPAPRRRRQGHRPVCPLPGHGARHAQRPGGVQGGARQEDPGDGLRRGRGHARTLRGGEGGARAPRPGGPGGPGLLRGPRGALLGGENGAPRRRRRRGGLPAPCGPRGLCPGAQAPREAGRKARGLHRQDPGAALRARVRGQGARPRGGTGENRAERAAGAARDRAQEHRGAPRRR
mmetsp:Transcript_24288/g.81721  ORF Transcript_24288/g.81721 Transcript_24288/m.81721 type:complete len:266 (+) Transcript_24288:2214-3011(+)